MSRNCSICAWITRSSEKSGAWFSYQGEKIGQGKEAAKNHIKSDPALMEELAGLLKEKMNPVHQETENKA